jgi:hypothetical protein
LCNTDPYFGDHVVVKIDYNAIKAKVKPEVRPNWRISKRLHVKPKKNTGYPRNQ